MSSANSKCIDLTKRERARKCDLGGCRYYQQFALLPPELRLAHHWRPGSHNRSTAQPLTSAQEDNKDTSKRSAPTREGHYFRIISKRRAQVSERWVCLAGGAAALRAVLLHGPKSSHRAKPLTTQQTGHTRCNITKTSPVPKPQILNHLRLFWTR